MVSPLEEPVFWQKLIDAIKKDRPKFELTNIDFRVKGFTGEERFPVQFWNSVVVKTQDKLLSSIQNNWLSHYQKFDVALQMKNYLPFENWLETVVNLNIGKENISSLFVQKKKTMV